MTVARSRRPGRAPADFTDRPDLSAGSLRFGHGVKFLSATIIAALALSACSKSASRESSAPEARAAEGEAPDDIDALERELGVREQQLAALRGQPAGSSLAGGGSGQAAGGDANKSARTRAELEKKADVDATEAQSGPMPATAPTQATTQAAEPPMRDAPQDRCTTVCELSTAICGLQDRICELAPRHPGEPRYQAACQRAARDCEASQEACHACA